MFIVPGLLQQSDDEGLPIASEYDAGEAGHHYSSLDPIYGDENAALSISTYPNGARVFLNDELVGVTPFEGVPVKKGEYSLAIEKPDFSRIDTSFAFQADHQYFFVLEEAEAMESAPAAASVSTESAPTAARRPASPATTRRESAGKAATPGAAGSSITSNTSRQTAAALAAGGGRTASTAAAPRPKRTPKRPAARAAAIVTSTPAGAAVFLNDEFVGNTPVAMGDLQPGESSLTFQLDGYEPHTTSVDLLPSIQVPSHATLKPTHVSSSFDIAPSGDLYVDGQLIEADVSGRIDTDLSVGEHRVRVVHPELGQWSGSVRVEASGNATLNIDLTKAAYDGAMQGGMERVDRGEYAEALVFFRRALTIKPNDQAARGQIASTELAINERGALSSQPSRPSTVNGVHSVAEVPPVLIGGLSELHRNVKYPDTAMKAGIEGRVYVEFVVDEDGRVLDPKVTKGLPMGCNEAAVRAVQQARFKPGMIDGKPVKVRQTLFINFRVN
jgi:TonB family protein